MESYASRLCEPVDYFARRCRQRWARATNTGPNCVSHVALLSTTKSADKLSYDQTDLDAWLPLRPRATERRRLRRRWWQQPPTLPSESSVGIP